MIPFQFFVNKMQEFILIINGLKQSFVNNIINPNFIEFED